MLLVQRGEKGVPVGRDVLQKLLPEDGAESVQGQVKAPARVIAAFRAFMYSAQTAVKTTTREGSAITKGVAQAEPTQARVSIANRGSRSTPQTSSATDAPARAMAVENSITPPAGEALHVAQPASLVALSHIYTPRISSKIRVWVSFGSRSFFRTFGSAEYPLWG